MILLSILVPAILFVAAIPVAEAALPVDRSVAVQSDDRNGLVFEFTLPTLTAEPAGNGMEALRAEGFMVLSEVGAPSVPIQSFVIALPPGARVSLETSGLEVERTDRYSVAPVPEYDGDGRPDFRIDDRLSGRLYPERWFELSKPAMLRDQRVVKLTVQPVRHDFLTGATEILRRATVRVRFTGGRETGRGAAGTSEFESVYRNTVLNYRSGLAWRAPAPAMTKRMDEGDSFASSADWIKIRITERGLYRITYGDLQDAGLIDPRSTIGDARGIRMYAGLPFHLPEEINRPRANWMNQVAILVNGEEDGSFDPEDTIEFFALPAAGWAGEFDPDLPDYYEHFDNQYSWDNFYWITWGGSFSEPVKTRIASVDAGAPGGGTINRPATFTDRVHSEDDIYQDLSRYGEDGWFMDKFSTSDNDKTFWVQLQDADSTQDGNVRIGFYHYSDESDACGNDRAWVTVNDVAGNVLAWDSCRRLIDTLVVTDTVTSESDTSHISHIAPAYFDSTAHWIADDWNRVDIRVTYRMRIYLSWIEIGYERFFRARGGELHFRIDEAGIHRVPIAGLSVTDSRLFDVTDPFDVKELDGLVESGDSLVLHADVGGDAATYHALSDIAWKSPSGIERVVPANLRNAAVGAEYLIVCYDDFENSLTGLLAHRSDRFSVRMVSLSDVYNEFSWGVPDAVAIRDFLSYAYHHWDVRPLYVLLVGDATSDFKGRSNSSFSTLLPSLFHIDNSGSENSTYANDDFFTYISPTGLDNDWAPDIAIGRFPVNTAAEARILADKTVEYEANPELGSWRTRFLFLADDEIKKGSPGNFDCGFLLQHTRDTEKAAVILPETINREKLYMTEYPLNAAFMKPLARKDYIGWINDGFLLSNYLGHGGIDKIADEGLLTINDVAPEILKNGRRLHIFCAYSCSIGSFDLLNQNSIAEALLKLEGGGAVGSFSSDAPAYGTPSSTLNQYFLSYLVPDPYYIAPIGMAVQSAKVKSSMSGFQVENDQKYALLADPALTLGFPRMEVHFRNQGEMDCQRGKVDTLYAEVTDSLGTVATWLNGVADLSIWGMADTSGYSFLDTACFGSSSNPREKSVSYSLNGPTFFRGSVDVTGGRFRMPYFVPLDTRIGGLGRVSAYVSDGTTMTEAVGGDDSLNVTAEPAGAVFEDRTGPEVQITVDGASIREGLSFTREATFRMQLSDESGINLQRNDNYFTIHLILDQGQSQDLTPLFQYNRNSFQEGELVFRLSELPDLYVDEGDHLLSFRMADNLNNRTELDYQVFLVSVDAALDFRSPVLNYPNPFDPDADGVTEIVVELTRSARVTVQIMTNTGKRIREMKESTAESGLMIQLPWDGRDQDGDMVANGVYLIRVLAESDESSQSVETVGKAVVIRGGR